MQGGRATQDAVVEDTKLFSTGNYARQQFLTPVGHATLILAFFTHRFDSYLTQRDTI
jgi:hypothetical protein